MSETATSPASRKDCPACGVGVLYLAAHDPDHVNDETTGAKGAFVYVCLNCDYRYSTAESPAGNSVPDQSEPQETGVTEQPPQSGNQGGNQ